MRDAKITDIGCYLDGSRGVYITRDTIQFACGFGFIIGPFEQFAIDMFEDHDGDETFPFEAMIELCDDAIAWLNSGQENCVSCLGTGNMPADDSAAWLDKDGNWRCKACTGTGQGPRIEGQNFPPRIPEGTSWAFEDGDFGLWKYDDEGMVTE